MRMHVDKARRDDESLGVDLTLTFARDCATHRYDLVAFDRHVANEPRIAGAIDDTAIAQDQVVFGFGSVQGGTENAERGDREKTAHGGTWIGRKRLREHGNRR